MGITVQLSRLTPLNEWIQTNSNFTIDVDRVLTLSSLLENKYERFEVDYWTELLKIDGEIYVTTEIANNSDSRTIANEWYKNVKNLQEISNAFILDKKTLIEVLDSNHYYIEDEEVEELIAELYSKSELENEQIVGGLADAIYETKTFGTYASDKITEEYANIFVLMWK